jgi:hypothetical protein
MISIPTDPQQQQQPPVNQIFTFGKTEGNTTWLLSEKFKLLAFPTALLEPFIGLLSAGQSLRIQISQAPEEDRHSQLERKALSESITNALCVKRPQLLQVEKVTSNFANLRLNLSAREEDEIQRILLANGKQVEWQSINGPSSIQVRGLAPSTSYEFVYIQRKLGKAPVMSAPLQVKTAQENDSSAMLLWISPKEPQRIALKERANAQLIACTFTLNQQVTHAFISGEAAHVLEAEEMRMLREWKIFPFQL